jgi:long-chain fatty acid transport protein
MAWPAESSVYLGGELLFLDRNFRPNPGSPLYEAGVDKTIHENTAPTFLPVLGATTRFGYGPHPPTRFALGLAAYVPYGGSISYRPVDVLGAGLQSTQIVDLEIAPSIAYQVNDVLAIGAALRLGVGLFDLDDVESAYSAKLSLSGVGLGGTFGVMLRPHPRVQIGAVYRTPLEINHSGDGPVTVSGQMAQRRNASLRIQWPQSASLGLAVKPHARITLSVQGDWTGWSSVQKLALEVDGAGTTVRPMRFEDSFAVRLGIQAVLARFMLARLGWMIDTPAIPEQTVRRENHDNLKSTLAVGLGFNFWRIYIDAAFEALLPLPARDVRTQVGTENEAGLYNADIYSLELSAQIRF